MKTNLENRVKVCEYKTDCRIFYKAPNSFVLHYCIGDYEKCRKYVELKEKERYGGERN
jgi:hypothetical protein